MSNQKRTSTVPIHERRKKNKGIKKDSLEKYYHKTDEMYEPMYCHEFKKKKN